MFKNKLQVLLQSQLIKNILVVVSGAAGAQAIGMAFIPFITRTYGPEVYGTLGAFIALTGVLTTFASLSYPVAIVLPEKDNTAKSLVKLSFLLAASISLIIFFIICFAGEWIMNLLGMNSLIGFVFFIPVVMFLTACQSIAEQWLIRKKAFKGIANISIAHSVINYGSQALIGLYTPLSVILISIHALAIGIRSTLLFYVGKKIKNKPSNDSSKYNISLAQVAYKYRDFPLYRAPQSIINAISHSLPVIMLTSFFDPATAGFYALTRTVLGLPSLLLGSSVQSVFYPHFNEAVLAKNKAFPLLLKATAALAAIGMLPFLLVILFGPFLFEFVFGSEWSKAGQYAQWLSAWLFFGLLNTASASAIAVLRMQRWFLFYEISSVIFRGLAIYIGFFYFGSDLVTVAAFSLVGALLNIYLIIKVFLAARKNDQII